jgi:hypothetical protein
VSYCRAELSTGPNTLCHPSHSGLLSTFVNPGDALFVRKSPFEHLPRSNTLEVDAHRKAIQFFTPLALMPCFGVGNLADLCCGGQRVTFRCAGQHDQSRTEHLEQDGRRWADRTAKHWKVFPRLCGFAPVVPSS